MMHIFKRALLSMVFLLITWSTLDAFQFYYIPWQGRSREIETEHFVIMFPQKYEPVAREVATYVEDIHRKLTPVMNWEPKGKTNVVVTDHLDSPNGIAVAFIRNTIYLYLTPGESEQSLRSQSHSIYSLILHEYTHILHLDNVKGASLFWHAFFGKLYLPVTNSFLWYIEGMPVLNETLFAPGGRSTSPLTDAMVRTAALEDRLPDFDSLVPPVYEFPYNSSYYHFGGRFMYWLNNTYGKEKMDRIYEEISDDFWPFILYFVMNFEKIYGKELTVLWDEWRAWEKEQALADPGADLTSDAEAWAKMATTVWDFETAGGTIYLATSGKRLYSIDKDKKRKTRVRGYIRSVTGTHNQDWLLYTRYTPMASGRNNYDLYSYHIPTGREKRLSRGERINYASFAENDPSGLLVTISGLGSRLYRAWFFNGKIYSKSEIELPPEINFIWKPSLSSDGSRALFSARLKDGRTRIYILDVDSREISITFDTMPGMDPRWIDDESFSFVGPADDRDALYTCNLKTGETTMLVKTIGTILHGKVEGDRAWYVDYTARGQWLFSTDLEGGVSKDVDSSRYEPEAELLSFKLPTPEPGITVQPYKKLRNLNPTLWAVLIAQLDTLLFIDTGAGSLSLPLLLAPQFYVTNTSPLGRFVYYLTVTWDYMKMYPDNQVRFYWYTDWLNIGYSWNNSLDGFNNAILGPAGFRTFSQVDVEASRDNPMSGEYSKDAWRGGFPQQFSNTIDLYESYPLANRGRINWSLTTTHWFKQHDFVLNRASNKISFTQRLSYSYIRDEISVDSRWKRSFYVSAQAFMYPHGILDNDPYYLVKLLGQVKIPLTSKVFFFGVWEGGVAPMMKNSFLAYSNSLDFSETLSGTAPRDIVGEIDIKGLSTFNFLTAAAYLSSDGGFDISFIRKTRYIHFGTLVFQEFYLRVYHEIAWLYNTAWQNEPWRGFLFDAVVELGLDFAVAYGNIIIKAKLGGAVGYKLGDSMPLWNIFFYLSPGI
jgi:hypothetical protein